jgi:hypothetical protein
MTQVWRNSIATKPDNAALACANLKVVMVVVANDDNDGGDRNDYNGGDWGGGGAMVGCDQNPWGSKTKAKREDGISRQWGSWDEHA